MKKSGKIFLISIIGVFVMYNAIKWVWGETAETYFNYRCEKDAGEFIYRTVENVEGVFQMRPREKGDYFSRLRKGDLMKDPYGHTNREAERPWYLFLRHPKNVSYQFFETEKGLDLQEFEMRLYKKFSSRPVYTSDKYWRYEIEHLTRSQSGRSYGVVLKTKQIKDLRSKYGFTWKQIQNTADKMFGVIGGELSVIELSSEEIMGVRRGYFFWPAWSKKGGICPKDKHDDITYEFVSKVLHPAVENRFYPEVITK